MLGAENALIGGELSALLATARHDPVREAHHIRALVARRVDGIIVTGRVTDPLPPINVPMPVVHAFAPSSDPAHASVVPDDAAGIRQVVAHLHSFGRRRVTHVTGRDGHHAARVWLAALGPALAEHQMAFVGEPMFGEWSERWGRVAVDRLLESRAEPDAIVFGSDQLARGGADRLRERGMRVPQDVAITGYDNWDVMAEASRPPLTTVDMDLERLGQRPRSCS